MQLKIRPFRSSDDEYAAVVAIANANNPEYPDTVDEWKHWDETREPEHLFARWVIEQDSKIVGFGSYGQHSDMYHPRKFWFGLDVHPKYQGRGLGKAMFAYALAELGKHNALSVRASTREDRLRSVRFITERGFVEDHREWESRLDPTDFDFTPYADHDARLAANGVVIKTWRELQDEPDAMRKFYEMFVEADADEPRTEPYTPWTYEMFEKRQRTNPNLLPDALFIAIRNGEFAGMSELFTSQASDDLYTGFTGVRPAHRRNGIALGLKLRAIAFARARGTKVIKTWNDSSNRPMLSINERLGFVKQPVWINYIKVLSED